MKTILKEKTLNLTTDIFFFWMSAAPSFEGVVSSALKEHLINDCAVRHHRLMW